MARPTESLRRPLFQHRRDATFEKGEADIYTYLFEPDAYARYKADPATYNTVTSEVGNIILLGWNSRQPPLDRPEIRKALAYAVDRKQMVANVMGGLGVAADKGPLPPPIAPPVPSSMPEYPYDPARARQMLAEAGAAGLKLTAQIPNTFPISGFFTVIQGMWQQVGVSMELQQMDFGAWFSTVGKGSVQVSASPVGRPDPDTQLSIFTSGAFPPGLNFEYYSGIDQLVVDARKEVDKAKRDKLYQDAMTKFMTDLPALPLVYNGFTDVTHKYVQGYQPGYSFDVWLHPVQLNRA